MLIWIAELLEQWFSPMRLLQYTTFRALMAALTAFLLAVCFGPLTIRELIRFNARQAVRADGPQTHLVKSGTPTMGGVLIILSIVATTLLWARLNNQYVWLLMGVLVGVGALGYDDDLKKVTRKNSRGVSAKFKMVWLSAAAILFGAYIYWFSDLPQLTEFIVPFFKNVQYPMGAAGFIGLTYLVVVGSANAVNLTDGLDGLATLPVVLVAAGLAVFAYVSGHKEFADYLLQPHIPGAGEVAVYCAAVCGAGLGFLWWNAHPASMFMGDVGSLSLGATLGAVAVILRQEIVLAIMGALFVAEALSVILQVASYKLFKVRIFKMAPIHHHFEQLGWKETTVVTRFWIVTIMMVLLGLATLKIR